MSGSGMMSTNGGAGRRRRSLAFDDENDMSFTVLYDSVISLKKRTISLYVNICELRSYIQLNKTGFRKVLKKYDKIMDRSLKNTYTEQNVEPAYPFQQSTMDNLADNLSKIENTYANLCTQGDVATAKRELRLHLREHVVWERNTVWREMIGIERKAQAANLGIRQTILGRDTDPKSRLQGDDAEIGMKEISTPVGRYTCPRWLLSSTFYTIVAILAVFAVLLLVPIMKEPEQQNCLALVIFVSLLWATEVSNRRNSAITFHVLTISSPFPFLSHPYWCPSLWSSCVLSAQSRSPTIAWNRKLRRATSSLPCGRPSLCFFSVDSRLLRHCRSTTSPRSWRLSS